MGVKKVLALIVAIILIIVITTIITIFAKESLKKTSFQDLRTNLLLIQGKAKTYTEDVSVETANLDEAKEEDNTKISEVKDKKLKGTPLENCSEEIRNAAKNAGIEDTKDYYHLSQEDLDSMGISIEIKQGAYYLVKYNFEDTEVLYTKGFEYQGKTYYKLSEMKDVEIEM